MGPAPCCQHPGELIPPQLCPERCVCTENRLIPDNSVLGREELSQTIKTPPYPMEKAVLEGLVWLHDCMPACHAAAWP